MKKFIAVLLLVTSSAFATQSSNCADKVVNGVYPQVINSNEETTILCRRMYVVEHSPSKKTPYWAAEHLIAGNLDEAEKRVNAFKRDPDLPRDQSATIADYDVAQAKVFDKGHMAPVGDMHSDPLAMRESFYLSNMVPQYTKHNRGFWKSLEIKTRELAIRKGELYVITGPIYLNFPYTTIGESKVAVPDFIFKVLYDPKLNTVVSVLSPNVNTIRTPDLPEYVVTLERLESISGIRFFPGLKIPPVNRTFFNFNVKPGLMM